jgi:hypothetical protein
MVAILEERKFEGLGAVDEQSAKQAVLFAGNPIAPTIPADKDNG